MFGCLVYCSPAQKFYCASGDLHEYAGELEGRLYADEIEQPASATFDFDQRSQSGSPAAFWLISRTALSLAVHNNNSNKSIHIYIYT